MYHTSLPAISPHRRYLFLLTAIILIAAALRFYALTADAPFFLSPSQGITTDGATTVGGGRDKILFGDWAAFTPERFYYKFPAMGWISFAFFQLIGIGYWQANLIPVISGLLTIALIAAYGHEQFNRRVALIAALFMATNYAFLIYNRIPVVYSPLACGMALALYFWGRGGRHPGWYFASLLVALYNILFLKLAGLAFLPVVLVGFLVIAWQKANIYHLRKTKILAALIAGTAGFLILFFLIVPKPDELLVRFTQQITSLSFRPSLGLGENVRFVIQSFLQFGIYAGFFIRMLPLLVLSFGYAFVRVGQLLVKDRPRLSMGELALLLYLLGTVGMLLMTNSRPTRYMILLVPPMSLAAAVALDRLTRTTVLSFPSRFGLLYPVYVQLGLAYLIYLLLASIAKLFVVAELGSGLADPAAVLDVRLLFGLLATALLSASIGTFMFLWRTAHIKQPNINLPSATVRKWIAVLFILVAVGGSLYQYWTWARDPQYSLVQSSRQVGEDFDSASTVMGGSFAYVLTMENEIPAWLFYARSGREEVEKAKITHLAVEVGINDQLMHEYYPDYMERTKIVKTYPVHGYEVKVYEVEPIQ